MKIHYFLTALCLCLIGEYVSGQEKPSSLFDSTEFSNKSPDVESDQAVDVRSVLLTNAYRKGEATRVGLNYLPTEFESVVYFSQKAMKDIETSPRLASFTSRLLRLNQTVGLDLTECKSLVRGWLKNGNRSGLIGTQPNLLVAMNSAPFDTASLTAKKTERGSLTFYRADDGSAFGFPKPDILVLGTTNEVLNALRIGSGKGNDRQAGLEWIDYASCDTVRLSRARSSLFNQAYFTKDNSSGSFQLFRNSGLAKFEKERREILWEFFTSPDPASFLAKRESEMKSKGAIVVTLTPEMRAKLIESAEQNRRAYESYKLKTSFEQIGPVLRAFEEFNSPVAITNTIGTTADLLLPELNKLRSGTNRNPNEAVLAFEQYKFPDYRDGTDVEENIIRGFSFGRSFASNSRSFGDRPAEVSRQAEWILHNTSSRPVRNMVIQRLIADQTPQAIMILGIEAHRFDLSTAKEIPDPEEDDRPELLGPPSISRNRSISLNPLNEILRYYLNNPGDPILLTAVCKIAGDLKLTELRSRIVSLSKSPLATDRLKDAALAALESIGDSTKTPRNYLQAPADVDTALAWIKGTERAKKAAGLLWVMQNPDLGERHSEFVGAIIYLLDNGLLFREATQVLKRICKPEDAPQFRQVMTLAANPRESNFKMRQEYSILRVAEIAFHLKDEETLKLAYKINNYDLTRFLKLYADQNGSADAELGTQALDQFIKDFTISPDPNSMRQLSRLKLSKEHSEIIKQWARRMWQAKDPVVKDSDFWRILDNCKHFDKADIPLLIDQIFTASGFNTEAMNFLAAQGTSIEPLILEQLSAGRKMWVPSMTARLLGQVGTEKSIPVLQRLATEISGDKERVEREQRIFDDAIQTIRARN